MHPFEFEYEISVANTSSLVVSLLYKTIARPLQLFNDVSDNQKAKESDNRIRLFHGDRGLCARCRRLQLNPVVKVQMAGSQRTSAMQIRGSPEYHRRNFERLVLHA